MLYEPDGERRLSGSVSGSFPRGLSRLVNLQTAFTELKNERRRPLILGIAAVVALALFFVVLIRFPLGSDWHASYRPAALALLLGQSPYTVQYYFAPPWAVIPLIPLAILPEAVGRSIWFVISLGMWGYIGYRLGGKPAAIVALLISPPVANSIVTGNIDWLVLLGAVLPPYIGLIFLSMKPQMTSLLAAYLVWETWHDGGLKQVLKTIWPVTVVILLSLVVYGLWPLRSGEVFDPAGALNIGIWPKGIPIALTLFVIALRTRSRHTALIASPFLSPYTILIGWCGAMAGLVPQTPEIWVASISMWVFWLMYKYGLYSIIR